LGVASVLPTVAQDAPVNGLAPGRRATVDAGVAIVRGAGVVSDPGAELDRLAGNVPPSVPPRDIGRVEIAGPEGSESIPSGRGADLSTGFSPFDRATLERTIDQLFRRLDDLGDGFSLVGTGERLVPGLLAAVAVSVAEALLWRLGVAREDSRTSPDGDEGPCPPGLHGLPRHWGLEER
jgi:hypothetical protein